MPGMVVVDAKKPGWPLVYVNPAIEEQTGHDAEDLLGSTLAELSVDGELPEEFGAAGGRLAQRWAGRDGEPVPLEFRTTPLYERPGDPAYLLLTHCPEPEKATPAEQTRASLRDARARLRREARCDPVTGLSNRRAFEEFLRRDWSAARRSAEPVCLVVYRVDDFELYRNLFGRHAAESCLRKVSHAIAGALRRDTDLAARVGPAHFAVLVGRTDEARGEAFAATIAARVRELSIHHPRSGVDRYITVSYGVAAEVPSHGERCDRLFERAELGLAENRSRREDARRRAG